MKHLFLLSGVIFAGLSVAFGAFAAHGLKAKLAAEMLINFEVGARYQMYHALALTLLGTLLLSLEHPLLYAAGSCFVGGIVIFSGSLYILSLTGNKAWGALTPIGGILFLIGWAFFGLGVLKSAS